MATYIEQINPYAIPPLFCSILIFALGLIVLYKNPKEELNRTFFLLCLSATIWQAFYGINFNLSAIEVNKTSIQFVFRLAYCGVTFISITFFHFISVYINAKWVKKLIVLNYFYGSIVCYLILKTNYIINGLKLYYWGYYPIAGKLHPFYLFYFCFITIFGLILLFLALKQEKLNNVKANQIKYTLAALLIFDIASVDFIPNYGIQFYPIGYIPTTIFFLIITYTIVKYQLMDINIVIRKSVMYTILITVISIVYLLFVFISEKYIKSFMGYTSFSFSILVAFFLGLIFVPLRHKIQCLIDKFFFHGTHEEIALQNELLLNEVAKSEKYKTLSTLSSGIAHEVKNPLTALKTFSEYLPQRIDDKEFLKSFSKIINKEVDRIDDLVHQLLDYGKPAPLSLKKTDIHKLITDTLEILNNKFFEKKISVHREFNTDKNITLNIDPNQIRQALLNILLNALEAMPQGGRLLIKTEQRADCFKIVIRDTGEGISPEDLKHIFDPFFTKKDEGTGLGLSITQGIIEKHKGKLKVRSKLGMGAEAVIELPVHHENVQNDNQKQ